MWWIYHVCSIRHLVCLYFHEINDTINDQPYHQMSSHNHNLGYIYRGRFPERRSQVYLMVRLEYILRIGEIKLLFISVIPFPTLLIFSVSKNCSLIDRMRNLEKYITCAKVNAYFSFYLRFIHSWELLKTQAVF